MQHSSLAAGRWKNFSLMEQMANIGSEVGRAINWRAKGNEVSAQKAFDRALELFDLTLEDEKNKMRLKEVVRARETFVDYFAARNEWGMTAEFWNNYFYQFTFAARYARQKPVSTSQ